MALDTCQGDEGHENKLIRPDDAFGIFTILSVSCMRLSSQPDFGCALANINSQSTSNLSNYYNGVKT